MCGPIIISGKKNFIGLLHLEYGWWVATWFEDSGQKLYFILEDDWIDRWDERGWPLEIYLEDGDT